MGASRSSTRAVLWFGAGVCLALAFPLVSSAETRNVTIPVSEFIFVDEFTGNDTTFITMGDTVNWKWGPNPPMDITIEPHTTTSGVCGFMGGDPDCGGRWSSSTISSGTFQHTATFATPGDYVYHCHVHFPAFPMSGTIRVERPLDHFEVSASPNPTTAGNVISVTVTAKDSLNQTILGYRGTVHFTSNDAQAILPADSMLNYPTGTRIFNVTLRTSGTRSITVNDVANPSRTGTANVTVNHAAVSELELTAPAASAAGVPFLATVRARDAFNNTATSYSGTVTFTSSDPFPTLPANSNLQPGGIKSFPVTLNSAGSRTLTVRDTVNAALTDTATINVSAATCSTTFSNTTPITINAGGAATPYPSSIVVGGLNQDIDGLSVTLSGLSHAFARDIDVLLVGPAGQKMIIMSDSGSGATDVTLTLTDSASALLPSGSTVVTSGSFRPTNFGSGDTFPVPAPVGPYASPASAGTDTLTSVFGEADPNGTWTLYVFDDFAADGGSIAGGWSLTFDAPQRTFCNPANISIPSSGVITASTPYPSPVEVVGLDGTVKRLSLRLDKLSHSFPTDVDMLLVGPQGQKMIFFSDLGLGTDVTNLVISLDDAAANPVPAPIVSGVFRPSNTTASDPFAAPAPAPPYTNAAPAGTDTFASVFNNTNPNGTWNLFVVDDVPSVDGGSVSGGWALSFDLFFNTTTGVTSNINPSIWGQVVTFTANVTSSGGTPTGTVQFKAGAVAIGTPRPLTSGSAQLLWAALTPGLHNITAEYSGDANFNPSTSTILVQTVNKAPTTTSVISSLNPSTFGQSVTFTATVSESAPNPPTGTVTFMDGATPLGSGTVNASGVATFATNTLAGGSHMITAVYNSDTLFATSTSPALTQTVNKATTTSAVATSVSPSTFGNSVTFTTTVSESTAGTATGTVTFRDGTTTLGTGTLNGSGVATFATSALTGGGHSINVVYGGDGNFNGSTSPSITQTVNKRTPSTSVISFLNPSTFTDEVIFRADVTATVTPPAASPTGTVTFKDGAATLGTLALSSGTAQISTSTLAGGSHNITAVYNGDVNYNTHTSDILVQEVTAAETSTALGSSLNPSTFGEPVTFTATVSSGVGTAAGTVTFRDGATPLGAPSALNGLGIATLVTPSLTAGSHSITAMYNSNGSFASSTSAPVTQNVNQSATTVLVSAPATSVFREAVTFTVAVASTTSGTPTGTVTFFNGATELESVSLNAVGEAAITITGLPVGRHEITVQYAGDSNFPANASPPLVHYRSPKPRGQP